MFLKKSIKLKGQVLIEFTFCMIIILLMLWSMVQIMGWVSRDPVARRQAHYDTLRSNGSIGQQLDSYFYEPIPLNAIWRP
ncbi:MAG: hypothetical protein A2306_00565 [Omnitrophica WOR_2 bacterium RIFOXYB2_FULL_38_16]|nr:MAG: hypothetical protein A2Y06_08075 [Omnitrophica WOR_2 bacterium GWA2_37_7]OGX49971.1 MAG: hypothetical protein A2243_11575 [Omnitrophica WOR_2 bacterium RIFOXYA2_FULL_38_17]OGX53665.1 MAG: hypothetical protein A2267_09960 [Omnitrophica WOR_2 bacterium RIFOXYA12_FULL_38_10]OGX56364.1 MAG: hypothetical protein A2306_00565 [Omnitrophica WOR_2 bacterium RIFOXYB2_FULL_38_16]OGX58094.1 MAG: hypothetical protein A2447_01245 [Omnitrophica WOR_2 bacterium RIFOXYC2_FULL_38_12]HBG60749.1 hypotheti